MFHGAPLGYQRLSSGVATPRRKSGRKGLHSVNSRRAEETHCPKGANRGGVDWAGPAKCASPAGDISFPARGRPCGRPPPKPPMPAFRPAASVAEAGTRAATAVLRSVILARKSSCAARISALEKLSADLRVSDPAGNCSMLRTEAMAAILAAARPAHRPGLGRHRRLSLSLNKQGPT